MRLFGSFDIHTGGYILVISLPLSGFSVEKGAVRTLKIKQKLTEAAGLGWKFIRSPPI